LVRQCQPSAFLRAGEGLGGKADHLVMRDVTKVLV
jgi:hypothetical protein